VCKAFGIDVNIVKFRETRFATVEIVGRYRRADEDPLPIAIWSFEIAIGRKLRRFVLLVGQRTP
jgi:hypothetical protein